MHFAIISEIIMFLTNLSIVINNRMALDFYKIYYMSIPVVCYTAFFVIFYILHWKIQLEEEDYTISTVATSVAILINIFYCVIETVVEDPNNPWLFFICTVFIQLVNILFIFNIIRKSASEVTTPSGAIVLQIFNYITLFGAAYSMYAAVFTNIILTAIVMIATCALSALTMVIHFMAVKNQIRLEVLNSMNEEEDIFASEDYDEY